MGIFGDLGKFTGSIVGGVLGGATELVGEAVGSDFIKDIGNGVNKASVNAGNTVGQAADGVVGIAKGIVKKDSCKTEEGLGQLGDALERTVGGMAKGIGYIAENGIGMIENISEGDEEKAFKNAKNLVKVLAVSALAVGVADYVGIIGDDISDVEDGLDLFGTVELDDYEMDNIDESDFHFVKPHYVESHMRGDDFIEGYWRDGDGDTDVDLTESQGGGYIRSNSFVDI